MCKKYPVLYLLLFFILITNFCFGQNEINNWAYGEKGLLNFSDSAPGVSMSSNQYLIAGGATISDAETGELLFYNNGVDVWTRNHTIMENGESLAGLNGVSNASESSGAFQNGLTLPWPEKKDTFIIITLSSNFEDTLNDGISYSIIDMNKNNKTGSVVERDISLLKNSGHIIAATHHCNGRDIWIVGHSARKDTFYVWLFTKNGISTPLKWNTGYDFDGFGVRTQQHILKFTPSGRKLVFAAEVGLIVPIGNAYGAAEPGFFEIYDFNKSTGEVSESIEIRKMYDDLSPSWKRITGVEFSPNGSYVFVATAYGNGWNGGLPVGYARIYRYSMDSLHNNDAFNSSQRLIGGTHTNVQIAGMQLAKEDRIYIINNDILNQIPPKIYFDAIYNPDLFSPLYINNAIVTGRGFPALTLPNYMSSYFNLNRPDTVDYTYDLKCNGDAVRFISRVSDSVKNWSWDFGDPSSGVMNSSTDTNPTHLFSLPGEYTVRLIVSDTDEYGCLYESKSQKEVLVLNDTSYLLSPDTICEQNEIKIEFISGATGVTYAWNPGNTLDDSTISSPIAKPDTSTLYTCVISNGTCADTILKNINVLPPLLAYAGEDTTICWGDTIQLGEVDKGYKYQWDDSKIPSGVVQGMDNDKASNPIVVPEYFSDQNTITYYLNVSFKNICFANDEVKITVEKIQAVVGDDKTICIGDSVEIGSLLTTQGQKYRWVPSIYLTDSNTRITNAFPDSTTLFTLSVSDHANFCFDTGYVLVTPLLADIEDLGPDTTICKLDSVTIGIANKTGYLYTWSPPIGLSNPYISSINASPEQSTTYRLYIQEFTQGCEVSKDITISINDCEIPEEAMEIFIPNAIVLDKYSSNHNLIIANGIKIYNFSIYNSRGVKVYESTPMTNNISDLSYLNLPPDVYVYTFVYGLIEEEGVKYERKGNITFLK